MKTAHIGLLGLGTVGSGVYKTIQAEKANIEHKEKLSLNIKKVLALNYTVDIPEEQKAKSFEEILEDEEISIVIELIGGITPAKGFILRALSAGKTVVTANKELLARHWPELNAEAVKNRVGLYFEASVGGGIPVLRTIMDSLQANSINSIFGIINGTTNFILTKMTEEGRTYGDVLKEAQDLGYAEANPKNDVEGFDAAYKLSILASLAFHARVPFEFIYMEGISKIAAEDILYAKELGYVIKLLAIGKKDGHTIEARVHPTMIPFNHPLANVRGSFNAIFLNGSAVGDLMLYGRGAGDMPTASAVVSDVINACQVREHKYPSFRNEYEVAKELSFNNNWESEYFIRLVTEDKPGVLAAISGVFAKYNVSIATVIQKGRGDNNIPLIFVTHKANEISIKQAIADIGYIPQVINVANVIRVENT
jgi:homoserine dehydrogenase